MRKLWQTSIALASVLILSSCNAIDAIANGGGIEGTYELTEINGDRVPSVVHQEPGYRVEVLNANFTLEEDGTYTEAGIIRETVNGQSSTRSTSTFGYYEYYDGELTFDESGGHRYYGYLEGGTLIIEDQGVQMIYRRY